MTTKIKIKENASLSEYSAFHIGGKARYFIEADSPEALIEAMRWTEEKNLPFKIFSGGTNVVFPDNGLKCVIKISGNKIETKGKKFTVDAGTPLAKVVKKSINMGLEGLETLSGIPGTVGGATVGNAGAYGHSVSEVIEKVEIWDGAKIRWLTKKGCRFKYRDSVFKHKPYLVLRVEMNFSKSSSQELNKTSKDIVGMRLRKYPPKLKCPGSFFKNILAKELDNKTLEKIDQSKIISGKVPTGYLLEEVGAKGMRVGGVEIAKTHANLFVNKGRGTAEDVKKLAKTLKSRVKKRFGITLEEEVRYF